MKQKILPVVTATIWVSVFEFVRNQALFLSFWTEHYESKGLTFPAKPINGAIWGLWALVFTVLIYSISSKYSFKQAFAMCWTLGFVLMWLVIGNLGVLPFRLLWVAVPMSMFEVAGAILIVRKFQSTTEIKHKK